MSLNIAEVAFNLPLERTFHYLVPAPLDAAAQRGVRVAAPFGPRERVGFIVRRVGESPIRELKPIRRVIDPVPVLDEERWALAEWIASYYYCSLGEALAVMVPSALRLPARPLEALPSNGASAAPLTLSADQRRAFGAIREALDASKPRTLLLHGVTASGKTELYLHAIARILEQGRAAICLVPEIALTPQTIDRFRERFGHRVAVWHSRLTTRQRAQAWSRMAAGECPIVVGARSAVFAPVRRLGLVILDEEHESTYKQEDAPRYHARDVAIARARLADAVGASPALRHGRSEPSAPARPRRPAARHGLAGQRLGAVVLLGSATPSVESYDTAQARGALLTLPQRVSGPGLPAVEIVDMREELTTRRRAGPLSNRLERAVQQVVERGEQAMILLNRRGFARSAQCKTCGVVSRCARCAVPLIYHASRGELVCHYCNFHEAPAELCRACRKGYLQFRGAGTERVESELHRLFPVASIARMDKDTTRRRQSHRELYDAVKSRQVGLLVGTQMIAKGLDFPHVTLVGVASADTALNLPDFRAGERTFDLLTQVAGRAGRGDQPGRVIIQTFCPDHYAIQAARHHDYRRFYDEELRMRRRLRLPPFTHLIELTLLAGSAARAQEAADRLAQRITTAASRRRIALLGPAPHRIPRLRRTYRMCLVLKGRRVEPMVALLRQVLQPGRKWAGLPVLVNVDPL